MNINLLLLIYILINTVKTFSTIHLVLNYIDVLEVVILLMTCQIKYVMQTKLTDRKKGLNVSVFKMITGINESTILSKDATCEYKCRFGGQKVIQIIDGIKINADVNVKNMYVKKIIIGIVLRLVAKMKYI